MAKPGEKALDEVRFGIRDRHGMRQVKVLKAVKHPTSNEYATHSIKVLNLGERE